MTDFIIERSFKATPLQLFQAWTEPARLGRWWGPVGFELTVITLDVRPGGSFHYVMRQPQGLEMWGKFAYREIEAPTRMVFVNSFSDASGGLTRNSFAPTWPLEVLNNLALTEMGDTTLLRLSGGPINENEVERQTFDASHAGMRQGFGGSFDKLDAYLAAA